MKRVFTILLLILTGFFYSGMSAQIKADPLNLKYDVIVAPSGFCKLLIECVDRPGGECNSVGAAFEMDLCALIKVIK